MLWIVDDSPTELLMTERALGDGYSFATFADGAEVIERVAAGGQLPDVLLLDWVMPGIGGDEVCRFLRAQPNTRDLPVIIITSRVKTSDVVQGLSCGANDYVPRPFAPEELRARVNSVLRTKALADASKREHTRLDAINQLGRKLLAAGASVERILEELADTLIHSVCDGCAISLLPGEPGSSTVVRHHADRASDELAALVGAGAPATYAFESSTEAVSTLAPAYHPYIARFGLHGLGIIPFPELASVRGTVIVTRDGGSAAFDVDDFATIETCIEYAALGLESVMRLDAERIANARLNAVLGHAPIGIVVTDALGAITLTNPSACRLIPGIDRASDAVAVHGLATWLTLEGATVSLAAWQAAVRPTSAFRSTEVAIRFAERGETRTLSVSSVPFEHDGALIGAVTTIEDVSAARQVTAERERRASFQEQMLGIVGHDLRTPLGAMMAGISAIEYRIEDNPAVARIVGLMHSSGGRMSGIIDQLLDVTRARLGDGIPVEKQSASLTRIAREVVDELILAHPAAKLELIALDDVVGTWDPNRLAQVISNLASNAIQYGRPLEPIVIEVTGTAATATVAVRNAVRDQPLDADRLGMLFDPYQRGAEARRHASGLGLGLYIVSEIVRAHRGTIAAESTLAGTVFRVELPRCPPA